MLNKDQLTEDLKEIVYDLRDPGSDNSVIAQALANLFMSTGPSNFLDMQCNFSALMYILTEQQAIIGRLLEELIQAGVLNSSALERVTNVYGNEEALTPVYNDLYKRFVWYYGQIKGVLTVDDLKKPDAWNPFAELEKTDEPDPA